MFRRIVLASASVLALSAAAYADGSVGSHGYYPAVWSGFYLGANGGWAWRDQNDVFAVTPFPGLRNVDGGFGGGQIGYNWQSGHFVLGVEADIQGAGIEEKTTFLGVDFKSGLDWFGTVRGRLGYAFGPSLLYATGGFAYGGVTNEVDILTVLSFKNTGTATGYTIGGGYEYKFARAWSLKAEYQYINLGRNDPEFSGVSICSFPGITCRDDAYHTVRLGLNYSFGADRYAPLK
jgi:outer membrane immunogenic protein